MLLKCVQSRQVYKSVSRRNVLTLFPTLYITVAKPAKANTKEQVPKDIFLLQQVVAIDNLLSEYMTELDIDLAKGPDKYVAALLNAYDELVMQIDDESIRPVLRQHLSRMTNPFKSCAKNNCA